MVSMHDRRAKRGMIDPTGCIFAVNSFLPAHAACPGAAETLAFSGAIQPLR
jgi:hypothetical protein